MTSEAELRKLAERVLTPKQLQVFRLHAAGYSSRRIARILGISRWTVRDHLTRAYELLEFASKEAA